MTLQRVTRFEDRASLVAEVASSLIEVLIARQAVAGSASLCLTGGDLADEVYDRLALTAPDSALKADEVHLWWNWDYFIATDNPQRNSLHALSRLAGTLPFDPAKIHPLPSSSLAGDPEAGAAQYAQELAESEPIDLCLLELGPSGQIAGLFPHQGQETGPTPAATVIGVSDAPLPHRQLITLAPAGLAACRQIWILAAGQAVTPALRAGDRGDPTSPVTWLAAADPQWFVDPVAAAALPFHRCTL